MSEVPKVSEGFYGTGESMLYSFLTDTTLKVTNIFYVTFTLKSYFCQTNTNYAVCVRLQQYLIWLTSDRIIDIKSLASLQNCQMGHL